MATVFERLEEKMAKLMDSIEEMKTAIQQNSSNMAAIQRDINSAFLSFSDMIGKRIEEMEEKIMAKTPTPSSTSRGLSPDLTNFTREMKIITNQLKNMMENTIEKMRQITVSTVQPSKVTKTVATTTKSAPKVAKSVKIESKDLLPPAKRAPIPIKIGKTVPAEVLDLLDSLKSKIEYPAVKFAAMMEQVRDEIVRIYKFHPAIYELGTFARKLKKYPQNMKIDPDVLTLLFDKIEEWKRRIGGQE
ncbi:MAG: hypothetical protein ACTSO9_15045 [Candidatus Helarchaeota archaeon]